MADDTLIERCSNWGRQLSVGLHLFLRPEQASGDSRESGILGYADVYMLVGGVGEGVSSFVERSLQEGFGETASSVEVQELNPNSGNRNTVTLIPGDPPSVVVRDA